MEEPLCTRDLIPQNYPRIGWIDIDRPITDWVEPQDPMLGIIPRWEGDLNYAPAIWGRDAYIKSFEKFTYATGDENIKKHYPKEWAFAVWAVRKEFGFLNDTTVIPMVATDKNVDSTPAYPKTKYFKTEEAYIEKYGMEYYIREYDRVCKGARPQPLWYLFLKKEILKKKKIEESDIRQILCTDPCYSRIGLMFEQNQNQRMKTRTEKSFGQCGWSPFEGGWHRRMCRLEREGNHYIEMDWSRFDGTIPNEVFHAIKEIRFSFLAKEYRTRENFEVYMWYCKHLTDRLVLLPSGEVTAQYNGNPSGQVSTTMDNNMCNVFFQAFEFINLNGFTFEEAKEKWKSYDTLVYGDDRITSTPCLPENYIDRVITLYKDVFGMWVKPENVKIFKTLEGVSFCGFTNRLVNGMYMPVPTNVNKLISGLVTPCKKLADLESLAGKILSYKVLFHNLPDDDPGKEFILNCELAVQKHMAARQIDFVSFTREILDYLWRGGP